MTALNALVTMDSRNLTGSAPQRLVSSAASRSFSSADSARALRFDDFEFDLRSSELRRVDGTVVPLRPKTELLLRHLLAEPRRLLGKDQLMKLLWPTAIVTDDSLVQCVGELRHAIGDVGQRLIRTFPRRGYRLECAVTRVTDETSDESAEIQVAARMQPNEGRCVEAFVHEASAPATGKAPRSTALPWLAVLVIASATLLGILAHQRLRPIPFHIDEVIAARATFAVMPFSVDGEVPVLRRLADDVADGIAAEFASRLGMRAIGRTATAAASAQGQPPAKIASALQATGAVIGHVASSKGAQAITIDVQLLAVPSGLVFWSEHYERPTVAGTTGIEQIGRQVVNAVRGAVTTRAVERSEANDASLDPADLTNRGWNDLDRRASIDDLHRGRRRFVKALRVDPDSVIALLGYAGSFDMQLREQPETLTKEERLEYERVVEHLVRVAPESATALRGWATMQMSRGRPELALSAIDQSIRLTPSFANAYVLRAEALLMLGRSREVQAEVERAIPLAQFDTRHMSRGYAIGAEAALMIGDDERARELARRAVVQYPGNYRAQGALAAAEALTGHEGGAPLAALRKLRPQATVANYDAWPSNHPDYVAQRARFHEGLRRAGLPDGVTE